MNSKSVSTLLRGRLAVPDYYEAKAAEAKAQEEETRRQQQQQIRREYSAAPAVNPYANYSTTRDTYPGESAQHQARTECESSGSITSANQGSA